MAGRLLGSLGLIAALSALTGCDPVMPSATGVIRLDPGVDPSAYSTLFVQAEPGSGDEPLACSRGCVHKYPANVKFPFEYDAYGGGIGTSHIRGWRVTAWLSNRAGAVQPEQGEPSATVPFEASRCFLFLGEYCGQTKNVDLTIGKP